MIAWLGTGLLGTNFVTALRARAIACTVWNRSAEKAAGLAALGAKIATTPAAAVAGAKQIHLTLSDDAAVEEVLAAAAIAPGQIIYDHTTNDPMLTAQRIERLAARGIVYLHAPVFMGPQNARDSTGIMLLSGNRTNCEHAQGHLQSLTGKLIYLGESPQRAAVYKLCGNLFLMFLTAGVAEMLKLATAHGVAPGDAAQLFDWFNPAHTLSTRANRMISGDKQQASWTLAMARKDAGIMLASAQGQRALTMLPAIIAQMDSFIARGFAQADWTVIGDPTLYTPTH